MRRFLALVLLVILPLQFAWAGAAVYCQHEPEPSAQHFGHHTHDVQASADEASGASSTNSADCGYHLPAAKCCFDVFELAAPILAAVLNASPPASFTSFVPDGLERPDRRMAFSASGGAMPVRS